MFQCLAGLCSWCRCGCCDSDSDGPSDSETADQEVFEPSSSQDRRRPQGQARAQRPQRRASNSRGDGNRAPLLWNGRRFSDQPSEMDRDSIDLLVRETVQVVSTLIDSEQDAPASMLSLHVLAYQDGGWFNVISSLTDVVPMDNILAGASINMIIDGCALPNKGTISKLVNSLQLNRETAVKGREDPQKHRNIAVVLGALAEKLAGPISQSLLDSNVLDYLIANLDESVHPSVILFSLLALEKFAQTTECKLTIKHLLNDLGPNNPFLKLERFAYNDEGDSLKRQIGFVARWALDNVFIINTRPYSYQQVNMERINVILNAKDVSEYLKVGPDGLEARCDSASFESARSTFHVSSGTWYFEAELVSSGIMQIGFATKRSRFHNQEGFGIGDDEYSVAFDGCRKLIWFNAQSKSVDCEQWKSGDIVGALIDFDVHEVIFSLNGKPLKPFKEIFRRGQSNFFAAASFMSFEHCKFNFGFNRFKHPPQDRFFKSFNRYGRLTSEEKVMLPRHIQVELMRSEEVAEDACTLCYDLKANTTVYPCKHTGFCDICAVQLPTCPFCRSPINEVLLDGEDHRRFVGPFSF